MFKKVSLMLCAMGAVLPFSAFAVIDTTAAVTEVTGIGTAVAAVGGALIGVAAIAVSYKWVKAALFN